MPQNTDQILFDCHFYDGECAEEIEVHDALEIGDNTVSAFGALRLLCGAPEANMVALVEGTHIEEFRVILHVSKRAHLAR
jgi:hypothetical protein